jgi:hypothetical protein
MTRTRPSYSITCGAHSSTTRAAGLTKKSPLDIAPKCSNSKVADSRLKDAFCDLIFFLCVPKQFPLLSAIQNRQRKHAEDDERESDDKKLEDTLKCWTEHRSATAQESGAIGLCCFADSRSRSKMKRHAEWHVATLWDGTT